MGQTFRFVLFLSSVLYCPLVSIPSNSSITEYKTSLRLLCISSPVHVIRHLGPGYGSNVSSSSAAALASCPASSFMLSSCHASPVMDFAFSQTCTLRKDRHVVIHVEFKQGWTCQKYRYFETSDFCKECRKIRKILLMSQTSQWSCDNGKQNSKFQFYSSLKNK